MIRPARFSPLKSRSGPLPEHLAGGPPGGCPPRRAAGSISSPFLRVAARTPRAPPHTGRTRDAGEGVPTRPPTAVKHSTKSPGPVETPSPSPPPWHFRKAAVPGTGPAGGRLPPVSERLADNRDFAILEPVFNIKWLSVVKVFLLFSGVSNRPKN